MQVDFAQVKYTHLVCAVKALESEPLQVGHAIRFVFRPDSVRHFSWNKMVGGRGSENETTTLPKPAILFGPKSHPLNEPVYSDHLSTAAKLLGRKVARLERFHCT